jgi:Holliday junction resolvase
MTEHLTAAEGRALMAKHQGHQPESIVLNQCRDYLRALGWLVVRMQQGMGSYRGIADLYCLRAGRSVWIECKATKGKQSEFQKTFEADVRRFGGEYMLVHSLDELIAKVRA